MSCTAQWMALLARRSPTAMAIDDEVANHCQDQRRRLALQHLDFLEFCAWRLSKLRTSSETLKGLRILTIVCVLPDLAGVVRVRVLHRFELPTLPARIWGLRSLPACSRQPTRASFNIPAFGNTQPTSSHPQKHPFRTLINSWTGLRVDGLECFDSATPWQTLLPLRPVIRLLMAGLCRLRSKKAMPLPTGSRSARALAA
jgi:hypothetical protein